MSLKLENLIAIFEFLSTDSWRSCNAVAQKMKVDRRTVIRYMDEIEGAFSPFPIIMRSRDGYRLCHTDFLETLQRRDDYAGLVAVMSTPLGTLVKGNHPLPDRLAHIVREMVETRSSLPVAVARPLLESMRTGAYLTATYRSKGKPKKHTFVPVKLSIDAGIPYIVSFDEGYGHLICLSASKLEGAAKTGTAMPPRQLAELRAYVNSAWGRMIQHDTLTRSDVRFQVNSAAAPYFISSPLHPSQRVETAAGGATFVSLRVHNLKELVRYILRFGRAIRIVSPQEAISELRGFLQSMGEFYDNGDGTEQPLV